MKLQHALIWLLACSTYTTVMADNWPQFRGPGGQGISTEKNLPLKWSATENIAWKTALPGESWSSPIVWEDRIFVTTATDAGRSCRVLALDRRSGAILWNREVFKQVPLRKERRNSYATPTPATDGERVYACFGDGSVAALSFSGEIVWTNRDYPFYSQHGLASSPILYRGLLIMARDGSSQGENEKLGWQEPWDQARIIALDTATGQERWQGKRGLSRISHGAPVIWEHDRGAEVISEAGDVVQGFDARTGKRLWSSKVIGEGKVPSTVIGGGLVYTAGGWGGKETIKAFKLGGRGDLQESNLVWEQRKNMPKVPSMLYVKPHLFTITDGGVAACIRADTGELIWQERVGGNFSASPVAAEGRIYFLGDNGETIIIEAGPEFKVLARNPLGETVQASMAISRGQLFIRSEKNLYCIGEERVAARVSNAPQWQEIELSFTASDTATNPYTDVEAWVDFTHSGGTTLRRPMFWDGGKRFRVRFTSILPSGEWNWKSNDQQRDPGLHGRVGILKAVPTTGDNLSVFERHGFWSIPSGGRNLVHADGTPRFLCADTPWALPWRATPEQVEIYARDRSKKGFNAALLMTVQPDMKAIGPRSRTEDMGFDVGFEDLPQGKLRQINPEYFQRFDRLVSILTAHGIAPVYQPVFHGYGWKGRTVAGNVVSAEDYARYCRYLVARYGARPAIWLVGGDGPVTKSNVIEQLDRAGQTIEQWDAYQQPTGIHYSPHALNRAHQDKAWLDFQWCQTGHNGEHVAERVADMWRNLPVKAVANGEPTYENIGRTGRAAGWWQGHEAWCNLTAGGTMGLVYGAASLWQWRLHPNEPDHADWCTAPGAGWREALEFEGSRYPGIATQIFEGLPFTGMEPNWTVTYGRRGLLVPGKLFVLYLPKGGSTGILSLDVPRSYRIFNPKTGQVTGQGRLDDKPTTQVNSGSTSEPRVLVFTEV